MGNAMDDVTFTRLDAWFIFCLPKFGADLSTWLRNYVFINRDAPPSYQQLSDCISKSLAAGILTTSKGKYAVTNEWLDVVYLDDSNARNEIEAMGTFQDHLLAKAWPRVRDVEFFLGFDDYDNAVAAVNFF